LNALEDQEKAFVVLSCVVDPYDVGVLKPGHDPGLSEEPFPGLRESLARDPFDRHDPFELSIDGPIDLSRPAFADELQEFITIVKESSGLLRGPEERKGSRWIERSLVFHPAHGLHRFRDQGPIANLS
jgi:hypothetical protein